MLTPVEAFKLSIETWEGLYQDDPADSGNYRRSDGTMVGTMRGVTPGAWARFLNRPITDITADMMRAISLTDAARVYVENYYKSPGFDRFPWGPVIDVLCDIGWGSGPARAVRAMQQLSGADVDGILGPNTIKAYQAWHAERGDEQAIKELYKWRLNWYDRCVAVRPSNAKYLTGWRNRAKWQTTSSDWWRIWQSGNGSELAQEALRSLQQSPSWLHQIGPTTLGSLLTNGLMPSSAAIQTRLYQAGLASGSLVPMAKADVE